FRSSAEATSTSNATTTSALKPRKRFNIFDLLCESGLRITTRKKGAAFVREAVPRAATAETAACCEVGAACSAGLSNGPEIEPWQHTQTEGRHMRLSARSAA